MSWLIFLGLAIVLGVMLLFCPVLLYNAIMALGIKYSRKVA